MKQEIKKEMINAIEVTRESIKNSLEISIDSYAEVMSRLDMMTYLILNEGNNSFNTK